MVTIILSSTGLGVGIGLELETPTLPEAMGVIIRESAINAFISFYLIYV
jgi:hypothetical protein